jgi:hypothetical protein
MKRKKNKKLSGRKSLQYRGTKCLNCSQPLDVSDIYCPYCSQLNSNKQLSAKDFFAEFLSSILVYDSRLRNTLKDLLFSPGVITRNYVNGQRLKYANPFRFFLSVSIIYFLATGLVNFFTPNTEIVSRDSETKKGFNVMMDSISANTSRTIRFVDSINNEKAKEPLKYYSDKELDAMSFAKSYKERFSLYNDFYEKYKIKNPAKALDSLHHRNTAINRWVYSKNTTVEKISENPTEFAQFLITKIPFFLFFFAPLFALFFWLIYSWKKYNYMEHMVFIFHIFSFIFLALLIAIIPDFLIGNKFFIGCFFAFIGPFYFYKALRNFYHQRRVLTLLKFVFLSTVFVIGLTFAAIIFVAASAAIY